MVPTPYLGEDINRSFTLEEDHFLERLGQHFQDEGKVEKKENRENQNLSDKDKIESGFLIEWAIIDSIKDKEIYINIKDVECNLSDGSSLRIKNFSSGNCNSTFSGTVISSDGQILVVEPFRWNPKVGDEVSIEKDFKAFDDMIWRREDHYYRLIRAERQVKEVDQKLNGDFKPIPFCFGKVSKLGNLIPSQLGAVNDCLNRKAVTLVQGPPGTGKTTFAAQLSMYLLLQGYEVLVTAFTHDAINNILERVLDLGTPVSKIGKKSKCSDLLKKFNKDSISDKGKVKSIIGMTIHELLKNHRKFDFIIVDEASQMDIVSGIHFLASSTKTIFIGDHMQLPNIPKIHDTEFSVSIFDLLRKVYVPSTLLTTYRFNQRICEYISPNFYEGKLECGEEVKDNFLEAPVGLDFSLLKILDTASFANPLLFVETIEKVEFLLNKEQASLASDLVEDFLLLGISKKEIGIIAPNNMQVNFIKKVLSARQIDWRGILIETVNKFQGQQKEVIIYSSVITKIGSKHAKYDFFFDIRRFNVAVSRAKKMAIVLGNSNLISKAGSLTPGGEKIADYLNKSSYLSLANRE